MSAYSFGVDNDWASKFVMGRRVNGAFKVMHSFYTDQGPTRYWVIPYFEMGRREEKEFKVMHTVTLPRVMFTTIELADSPLLVKRGVPLHLIKYVKSLFMPPML